MKRAGGGGLPAERPISFASWSPRASPQGASSRPRPATRGASEIGTRQRGPSSWSRRAGRRAATS
eukprot:11252454-Alexandrium_andersonii.AAC.1